MNPADNSNRTMNEMPQEYFENAISQSIELETLLGKELTVFFYDLDGNHELKTCYGDLCKTVNALMDYSHMLEMVCDQWNLKGFHRATYEYHANKLGEIAGKFQAGIGYDYAAAVEKCKKKRGQSTRESDVGDDALTQAFRKSQQKKKEHPQKSQKQTDRMEDSKEEPENSQFSDYANPYDKSDDTDSPWEDDD